MNRTQNPSYGVLNVVVAAMLLALAAGDRYGGRSGALIEGGIVLVGYGAIALWVRRNATRLDQEPAGELRLVRHEGNVTVYRWQPADVAQGDLPRSARTRTASDRA